MCGCCLAIAAKTFMPATSANVQFKKPIASRFADGFETNFIIGEYIFANFSLTYREPRLFNIRPLNSQHACIVYRLSGLLAFAFCIRPAANAR